MNQVPVRDLETMPRESSGRVELPCEVQLCVAAAMLRNTPGDEIKTTTVALRQPPRPHRALLCVPVRTVAAYAYPSR